tara:strand:+ start:205922 stop:206863 length:942 start_codon:yes stop_codon:yes gene_type:complete
MDFKNFGSKLKHTWTKVADKTADAYEATVDAVKDSGQFAIDLQGKALHGKIETAALSWDAIFVDEMLDGTKSKPEGAPTGADILKSIEEMLVDAQANITTVGSGKKVAGVIKEINKALDSTQNSAADYSAIYSAVTTLADGLGALSNDDKTQKALAKQDNAEGFANLVGMFDYQTRCEVVLARGNFTDLVALATADTTATVLSISAGQREAITNTANASSIEQVGAGRFILDVLKSKSSYIFVVDDEVEALAALNADVGTYNLSLSVPKNAAALTKHYGNQALSSTVDYTGRAVAATGKASNWVKDQFKKEPK